MRTIIVKSGFFKALCSAVVAFGLFQSARVHSGKGSVRLRNAGRSASTRELPSGDPALVHLDWDIQLQKRR